MQNFIIHFLHFCTHLKEQMVMQFDITFLIPWLNIGFNGEFSVNIIVYGIELPLPKILILLSGGSSKKCRFNIVSKA